MSIKVGEVLICKSSRDDFLKEEDCKGCLLRVMAIDVVISRFRGEIVRKCKSCPTKDSYCFGFLKNGEIWAKIGISNHKLGAFYE